MSFCPELVFLSSVSLFFVILAVMYPIMDLYIFLSCLGLFVTLDSEDLCLSSLLQSSYPLLLQKLPLSPTLYPMLLEVCTLGRHQTSSSRY